MHIFNIFLLLFIHMKKTKRRRCRRHRRTRKKKEQGSWIYGGRSFKQLLRNIHRMRKKWKIKVG
tara:strand:- start:4802 stop:4993 length:192 start_codon:yes stop_codon:yes gene_type:complete